jgi:Fe-S-cluster containining protein
MGNFDLMKRAQDKPKKLIGDMIQYKCQKCGDCCRKGYSIELSLDEMDFFLSEHPEVKMVYAYTNGKKVHPFFNTGTKCNLLKKNQCSIYRNRPFECRYYPFHLEEVDENMPEAYEYGKKFYQLYAYEGCHGLGKGEPWSPRKMKNFLSRILGEYHRHLTMLRITYKILTTDAFFKNHQQYGSGASNTVPGLSTVLHRN